MAAMLIERADDGWTWVVVDGVDGQRNARGDAATELEAYRAAHTALNIAQSRESNVREVLRLGCCEVTKRAEAAEARAAQAEADARLLGSLYYADDGGAFVTLRQSAALTEAEVDALGEIEARLFDTPDEHVAAALRRVLLRERS